MVERRMAARLPGLKNETENGAGGFSLDGKKAIVTGGGSGEL